MQDPMLHPAPQNHLPDGMGVGIKSNLTDPNRLETAIKSGGRMFYWIAGLSAINSLINVFGGGIYFVIGLATTLIIDGIAQGVAKSLQGNSIALWLGFYFALAFDVVFAVIGYFAINGKRWAFIAGMVLYALDTLLTLFFKDWLGLGFHLFFMWGIWRGFQALGTLKSYQTASSVAVPPAGMIR